MDVLIWLAAAWFGVALLGHLVVAPLLRRGPDRDAISGLVWHADRLFVRLRHRVTFEGFEALRDDVDAGPLVVVSNHTGSVDPFVVQAGCRFKIRWMMARELMFPALDTFWKLQGIIAVTRDGSDRASAREAIRHVRGGGVVGIFPEGGIVTPPRRVWPFYPGVGLIVARTKAPVLLVWVSGTPDTNELLPSLIGPSRARVRYVDLIRFDASAHAAEISATLRERLAAASGWPMVEREPPATPPAG